MIEECGEDPMKVFFYSSTSRPLLDPDQDPPDVITILHYFLVNDDHESGKAWNHATLQAIRISLQEATKTIQILTRHPISQIKKSLDEHLQGYLRPVANMPDSMRLTTHITDDGYFRIKDGSWRLSNLPLTTLQPSISLGVHTNHCRLVKGNVHRPDVFLVQLDAPGVSSKKQVDLHRRDARNVTITLAKPPTPEEQAQGEGGWRELFSNRAIGCGTFDIRLPAAMITKGKPKIKIDKGIVNILFMGDKAQHKTSK